MSAMSPQTREDTPSSASSGAMEAVASSTESSQEQNQGVEDVGKVLKRMDMEKTIQNLQQRLELASVKASHGWTDLSVNEIENRLTPTKSRTVLEGYPTSPIPYAPPSPSRPWQLIDVLWQPLPPPSNSPRYSPSSPSSPRKRSRDEAMDTSPSHRRASSFACHPASPLGQVRFDEKKKRSQSHSHTTRQDVDAAKALTAMFSSSPSSSTLSLSASLPIPPRTNLPPAFRPRSNSVDRSPKRRQNTLTIKTDREDTDAAELMIFLAQSPSPARTIERSGPSRALGGAARVLFADEGEAKVAPGMGQSPTPAEGNVGSAGHSNLAVAEPITASLGDST